MLLEKLYFLSLFDNLIMLHKVMSYLLLKMINLHLSIIIWNEIGSIE